VEYLVAGFASPCLSRCCRAWIWGNEEAKMNYGSILAGAVAAFILAAAQPLHAQALKVPTRAELEARHIQPLKSEQLRELLTNNTVYHIVPANGIKVPLLYLPDGTRFVRIRGQQSKTTWRIERDMVCEESVVLKREVCRSLFRTEGVGAICDEGSVTCDFGLDWAAGNPERLGL
jgi:hypothetical protein